MTVAVSRRAVRARARGAAADVRVVEMTSDDAWMRDIGPTFVVDGARRAPRRRLALQRLGRAATAGSYFPWDRDDLVARKVAEIEGADRYRAPFVLEGGAIHVDGEGTC